MSETSMVHKIALGMIPGVGDITARKLVSYTGAVEAVFSESLRSLKRIPGVGEAMARTISGRGYMEEAEKEAEYIARRGIRLLFYLDDDYPYRLKQCEDSPVTMYFRGNCDLNAGHILSVVGTRSATPHGRECCQRIIAGLAAHFPDLVVVSGLAYGIDICAHRAALDNELPTVAVLAHGLATIYPSLHAPVASAILERGGQLTDFGHTVLPERNNFLRRNRIIAGLADATLVVESGIRGGALITADIAASYNRDVMAVPGRPGDEWSSGCNALIRHNKAALVEGPEDIEYLLGWKPASLSAPVQTVLFQSMDEQEREVYERLLENGAMTTDMLSRSLGVPLPGLSALLLHMELTGIISPCPGNMYRLRG